MKPLLFSILPRPPHSHRDGLAIRNFHLLGALAGDFRVRAFSLRDPVRDYGGGETPEGVEIEWITQAARGPRRAAAAAGSLMSALSYSELLYRSRALSRRIAARAKEERPRWVVAHSYHVGPAAVSSGLPAWIDFHNLDAEIWRRTAESASSPAVRWFARIQAPRVGRLERNLAGGAAGSSCVSLRDAAALSALGTASEPLVVPNGVNLSRYRFRRGQPRDEMVFFVGDLSWPPNADAIRWFGGRVWPLVRQARPAARAEILGRGAPADLAAMSGPDFAFLGEGGDTRLYWERAAVAAVPLLAGGGTRLKILEAAACGVPVVSTSVGAEGLELEPGREIRLADSPEDFAREVVALLSDGSAAQAQATAARARVEALYGWDRIGRRFSEELLRRGAGA